MDQKAFRSLTHLTVEQLREAFRNGGYTYEAGELTGSALGDFRCERQGHLETRAGQLVIEFTYLDEEGERTSGKAYVELNAAGQLVAEH